MIEDLKRDINFYCEQIKKTKCEIENTFDDLSSDIQGFLNNMKEYHSHPPFIFDYNIDDSTYKIKINRSSDSYWGKNSCKLDGNEITYLEKEPNGAEDELLSVIKEIYYGKDREFLYPNKDKTYYRSMINMKSNDVSTTYISYAVYFCHKHSIMNIIEKFKYELQNQFMFSWDIFEKHEIYKSFLMIDRTLKYLEEKIQMQSELTNIEKELYGNDLSLSSLKNELSEMNIWFRKQTAMMISYLNFEKESFFLPFNNKKYKLFDDEKIIWIY